MTIRILEGHILDVLSREPAGSVHCAVCSPPYWKLRAYGTPPQVWPDGWVGELGQEESPEAYIAHLVDVFAAVRRVLRDDGSLWINLAGTYWSDPGGQNGGAGNTLDYGAGRVSPKVMEANRQNGRQKRGRHPWLKALDWVDVPGLFAHAMQAAGWLWRSDVVWVKPSALPESVGGTRWEPCRLKRSEGDQSPGTGERKVSAVRAGQHGNRDVGSFENPEARAEWADCPGCPRCAPTDGYVLRRGNGRPTKSTERVLLFIKRSGAYFDTEAVRETLLHPDRSGTNPIHEPLTLANGRDRGRVGPGGVALPKPIDSNPAGRNLRDWWVLSPEPLADEHYAAFPSTLPTRCIKAGTSERGCCPGCGAPWARVVDRPHMGDQIHNGRVHPHAGGSLALPAPGAAYQGQPIVWRPTCRCPTHEPVPSRVLDPFAGSGTTLIAADRLGRDAVGVELKPSYVQMAQRRVTGDAPLLLWGAVTVEGDTPPSAPEAVPLLLEEAQDAPAPRG